MIPTLLSSEKELIKPSSKIENIDSSNEFTVTFGYSGYSSYMEFTGVVDEDSKPEDFIRTESGYVFSGFSTKSHSCYISNDNVFVSFFN